MGIDDYYFLNLRSLYTVAQKSNITWGDDEVVRQADGLASISHFL